MSPKNLLLFVPAIAIVLVAVSCGYSAHQQDVRSGGEFGPIATGLAIVGSLAVALAIGVGAVIAVLVSKQDGRETAVALLLAAVMAPIGVTAGARLGASGIIPPEPTLAPELRPSPPPTNQAQEPEITGTMTLDLDTPNQLHVEGAASCESEHSLIREWDHNAEWDVEWLGRVVIISPRLSLTARPPGPTWVDHMTIQFADKAGGAVTYSPNRSLPQEASNASDGGQSGEVEFDLSRSTGPSASAPTPSWPASIKGRINWLCDI